MILISKNLEYNQAQKHSGMRQFETLGIWFLEFDFNIHFLHLVL